MAVLKAVPKPTLLAMRPASIKPTLNLVNPLKESIPLFVLIRMETLIQAVREMVPNKVEENIRAAQKAYEQTRLPRLHRREG